MHNICHCGKACTTQGGPKWKIVQYAEKKEYEVIYAKCIHGEVIIDKREKKNE